jgi:hypothetical protein
MSDMPPRVRVTRAIAVESLVVLRDDLAARGPS